MSQEFDVVFIGGGPAGYTGSIRAAQLGLNTAIIEKRKTLGGTCLNVGCIPSKALLDSSEHYHAAKDEFPVHGIKLSKVELDLPVMLKRKDQVVADLTGGVDYLMKKNKITRIEGFGKLISNTEIQVTADDGSTSTVKAKSIVLATGSAPNELPHLPYDGEFIVSSTEALSFPAVPKKMVVVGAGAIGLELGSVWMRLGAEVTVVEFSKKICGGMDLGISKKALQSLKKQGMNFVLEAKVTGADTKAKTVTYESLKDGSTTTVDADVLLVAAGRIPYSEGVGLEELGIERNDRGFVIVDNHFRTKHSNVYAVGDLIPGPMLAHKAEEEGVAVAEIISGKHGHVNYDTVPGVIYTWPEVAAVGKTEEQLKAEGIAYNSGSFPFTANGRAKALNCTEGLVKVLADKNTDRILGVHIFGPRASDLIAEAVVAMEFEGSAEDLALSFHAHPTLTETIREAALGVAKRTRQM